MKFLMTLENYQFLDDNWTKCWNQLRDVDPNAFNQFKDKFKVSDDDIEFPKKSNIKIIRQAQYTVDIMQHLNQRNDKTHDNKKIDTVL